MSLLYRMGTGNGSGGDLKPFIVNFTCHNGFIGKTVTMEFQGTPHAGEVVENVSGTVVLDGTDGKGKLTLYPMHDGLWKYYATSDVVGYKEGTITLEKWGNYPVELKDIPKGATFTPTDDVQTWLHCADVFNKSYTTISEVVADTTTLNTLIANENANDYLVRSTTFATDICRNESAMTYIGLNDYCANKLLADSTWLEAICSTEETLLKKVLNVFVPTLTGNIGSDGGEAISSSIYNNKYQNYNAFKGIFDKDGWNCSQSEAGKYTSFIGYDFKRNVVVNYLQIASDHQSWNKIMIRGWNGSEWVDIVEVPIKAGELTPVIINNTTPYTKYSVRGTELKVTDYYGQVHMLQFYGREA